jgi:hypothetical protein
MTETRKPFSKQIQLENKPFSILSLIAVLGCAFLSCIFFWTGLPTAALACCIALPFAGCGYAYGTKGTNGAKCAIGAFIVLFAILAILFGPPLLLALCGVSGIKYRDAKQIKAREKEEAIIKKKEATKNLDQSKEVAEVNEVDPTLQNGKLANNPNYPLTIRKGDNKNINFVEISFGNWPAEGHDIAGKDNTGEENTGVENTEIVRSGTFGGIEEGKTNDDLRLSLNKTEKTSYNAEERKEKRDNDTTVVELSKISEIICDAEKHESLPQVVQSTKNLSTIFTGKRNSLTDDINFKS